MKNKIEDYLIIGGMQKNQSVKKDGVCTTLTSSMGTGGGYVPMVVNRLGGLFDTQDQKHQAGNIYSQDGLSPNIDTMQGGYRQPMIEETKKNLRIRKLTPRECWRLMAFTDEDFNRAQAVNSDSRLCQQAGNSICVNVLMAIFKELFEEDTEDEHGENDIMPKLVGGVGEMTSNNGKQYYQQNRIYDANSIALCQSSHESFNPYYEVKEDEID